MASLYQGLNTARSGLMAGQTALDVTAHNISNAATVGYSRQLVQLENVSPDTGGYTFKPVTPYVGNGVDSSNVTQARDLFLDGRYRTANAQYSDYNQREQLLSQVEDFFNEVPSDSSDDLVGLSGQLSNLVGSFSDYQTPPYTAVMDQDVQSAASQLISQITSTYNSLESFQTSTADALQTVVTGSKDGSVTDGGINGILKSISDLNKEISGLELGGQKANDLRDQRNNLLDELSGDLDISSVEQSNGMVTVTLEGDSSAVLVDSENEYHTLQVNTESSTDENGNTVETYSIGWDPNGKYNTGDPYQNGAISVGGGSVNGYLSVLNGDGSGTGDYGSVGVVYLKERLNDFAKSFADTMNSVPYSYEKQADSTMADFDGAAVAASDSMLIYYSDAADAASSIRLSANWTGDTNASHFSQLFSDTKTDGDNAAVDLGDYAQAFTKAFTQDDLTGSASSYYTSGTLQDYADNFSNDVANVQKDATWYQSTYETKKDDLDTQRQSVSSVSIDEESINMIKYQQAYGASARVITTINDMLATLLSMATT